MVGLKSRLGHCTAVSDLDANQIKSYPKARQREQTMNVVLNGLWISDFSFQFSVLNLRPYTLSILMWRPPNEIQKASSSKVWSHLAWPHRRPVYFLWTLQIRIWVVYKTINGHIYFMFMLIFSNLINTKTQYPTQDFSFRFFFFFLSFIYVNAAAAQRLWLILSSFFW